MDDDGEAERRQRRGRLHARAADLPAAVHPLQQPLLHRRIADEEIGAVAGGNALGDAGQQVVDILDDGDARPPAVHDPPLVEPVEQGRIEAGDAVDVAGEAAGDETLRAPGGLGPRRGFIEGRAEAAEPLAVNVVLHS